MKKGYKIIKIILIVLISILFTGIMIITTAGLMPVKEAAPYSKRSTYVTMKDGTKLAVRYTLPANMKVGERVPAIMETTRYITETKKSFLLNALLNLKIAKLAPTTTKTTFIESGYAFVEVDARGSGASFGSRGMEWSVEEIADMGQLIDWIVNQEWSNGKVGTYGISYSGNTAELAAASKHSGLVAAAPLYPDFDVMGEGVFPGGISMNT